MTPSKEQMREVISKGDNAKNNSLILNQYGIFELRDFEFLDINNDKSIVVRFETLSKNTDFVGQDASNDSIFIDNTFIAMLECWVGYLNTKRINYYTDTTQGGKEADLIAEIVKLTAQL
jgi:hypothetical protein